MSNVRDDDIEALLRRNFEGPVADEGFSDKVMQRLPPRRRRMAWPLLAGVLAGVGGCAFSLLRSPLLSDGLRDWLHGEWSSMPAMALLLAATGMTLLACWWSAAEAEAR